MGKRSEHGHEADLYSVFRVNFKIYAPLFKREPLVTVPGPTVAGKRPTINQNSNLDLSFLTQVEVNVVYVRKVANPEVLRILF